MRRVAGSIASEVSEPRNEVPSSEMIVESRPPVVVVEPLDADAWVAVDACEADFDVVAPLPAPPAPPGPVKSVSVVRAPHDPVSAEETRSEANETDRCAKKEEDL